MNNEKGERMKAKEQKVWPSANLTNKTVHLPFKVSLQMGMSSRQARNGRWVPHRPCICCAASIGKEQVAGFRIELALLGTDPDWILIEAQSVLQNLTDYGLAPPQIITAEELAADTVAFLNQHAPGWDKKLSSVSSSQ